MITRAFKLWLWGLPFRATALRIWDRLPLIGAERVVPAEVPVYPGSAGPYPITRDEGTLTDEVRGIGLRYSLFRPRDMDGALPVVLFSIPMAWGCKRPAPMAEYFAEAMAARGYIVLRLWHTDSDRDILPHDLDDMQGGREYINKSVRDPEKPRNRFLDIPFVVDTLEAWNTGSGPLAGHIDLAHIGMSGFSFGGQTTLAALGQTFGPRRTSYKEARIKAGVICSVAPTVKPDAAEDIYAGIDRPILHMRGSRDRSWTEPTLPEDRTWAYHKNRARDQYLLVLKGADHVTFGGKRIEDGVAGRREAHNHRLIVSAALAFWDAYLKDDEAARHWLDHDFPRFLGRDGTFERK